MESKSQTIAAFLLRLLTFVVALAVALLLAEVAVRLTGVGEAPFRSTELRRDAESPFHLPDFRDRSVEIDKPEGVFRILAVGDSFTWGSGMHSGDAYPDRLGRRLAALPAKRPIEVVNWSRPGWNTSYEWRVTAGYLPRLQPDLLLIGFCLNDVEPTAHRRRDEFQKDARRKRLSSPFARRLARNSALFKTVWERLENIRQSRAVRAFYPAIFADEESWTECLRALRQFRRFADQNGIPMLVVVFPVFDGQIDDEYRYRELHWQIDEAAAELQIPVLDLLATYEGLDTRRLAVEPFADPHPNEIAHRLAADEIFGHLAQRGWLPIPVADELPATFP